METWMAFQWTIFACFIKYYLTKNFQIRKAYWYDRSKRKFFKFRFKTSSCWCWRIQESILIPITKPFNKSILCQRIVDSFCSCILLSYQRWYVHDWRTDSLIILAILNSYTLQKTIKLSNLFRADAVSMQCWIHCSQNWARSYFILWIFSVQLLV